MDEQQLKLEFIQYLWLKSGANSEEEFENFIKLLGEEGVQLEYAQFMLLRQQVVSRKFGGMLNYIGQLRGICPEGTEMEFFRQGGRICKKCVRKAKMEEGGTTPQNPVDAFRCGRKMKKKAACGTKLPMDKCGGKTKKVSKGKEGLKSKPKYTQTLITNKYGDVEYTRTYPGYRPVTYTQADEGEGFYSDHNGVAHVNALDSLARVYHNGPDPRKDKPIKKKN